MDSRDRRGAVLALAVMALVALGLLAHGALVMARAELAASQAGVRLLQARLAAEAGFETALAATSRQALAGIPVGATALLAQDVVGDQVVAATALRISRENWHLAGEGRPRNARWAARVGAPAWIPDPVGRLEALAGVVEVAGQGAVWIAGPGQGFTIPDASPISGDACGPWAAVLDSLDFLRGLPVAARVATHPLGEPSLGPLGPDGLGSALTALGWAAGTPSPAVRDGTCDESRPLNLGDPGGGGGACSGFFPARFHGGDLTLVGGAGQGLLAVRGDLVLSGTRFEGLLLVGGTLELRDGALLLGAARAGGGVRAGPSSSVRGSACRALRALEAALPDLPRAVLLARPVPLGATGG